MSIEDDGAGPAERGDEKAKDARAPESEEERKRARERARNYEFKIAPADPKNAFDFEDVADK